MAPETIPFHQIRPVAMSSEKNVTLDQIGGIRIVTFNRPGVLNSLSTGLAQDIVTALRSANNDNDVDGVVLTGAGERAFSAGVDLEEASHITADDVEPWFRIISACYREILNVEKPVVAALNGIAAGGGYQIAMVCDRRVGHRGTKMSQPEINAGLPSIMGAYWMSFHLPWSLNQDLSYTGRMMNAQECRQVGLLNALVDADRLLDEAVDSARALAAKSALAFRITKAGFREMALRGFDEAFDRAVAGMKMCYENGDPQSIMTHFLEKRKNKS